MHWDRTVVIKNKSELELMREAGRLNGRTLEAIRDLIRPGITTLELDETAEQIIRKHNASPVFKGYPGPYPFPATLTVSVNDELVHGIPGKRRLKEGDIVSVDCGTLLEGFVGDSAFTVGVGRISKEAEKLIKVTEQSLHIGIENMQPGNRTGDVSAAIQNYVEEMGFYR